MVFVFIYVCWCPTRFPCQMMFMSFTSNTTGVTSGARTATFRSIWAHLICLWCLIISFLCSLFQIMICPFSFGHFIVYPFCVLPFYCLSFLLFAILLSILWSISSDWHLQIYLKHIDTPRVLVRFVFSRSLVFYVVFCRSLFVLLSVLLWPLYFLAFDFFWLPLWYLQAYLKHIDAPRVLAGFALLDLYFSV